MNRPSSNSLYYQLRRAKKLDELMLFLEDPSSPHPGTYRRCAKAEPLLAEWGFAHSSSTIWRLYRQHILSWRMGVAHSSVRYTENPGDVEAENRRMALQRTSEFLTHPDLDPQVLIHLARIEHQKDVRRLNEKKIAVMLRKRLELAMETLGEEIKYNSPARAALTTLQEAIKA